MKEIKFRQLIRGKWHYWGVLEKGIFVGLANETNSTQKIKKSDQYTGLKDKNGKKIYEGDIVENQHGKRGVFRWDDRREGWDVWYKKFPGFGTMNECKVIGNIYENPKLFN